VTFLGVNSNRQDTPADVAAHAKRAGLPFPVLKDPGAKVADRFAARRTPEAFVLSPDGDVLYRGRIDDQFGVGHRRPGKPTRRDLAAALDEALTGKPVSRPRTEAEGCHIGRPAAVKASGKVTFTRDVLPILQKNCQECHRAGQIGPMSLATHDDAVSWADTIREVVTDGRMPPWFADPKHGEWSNDKRLSADDKKALLAWLDGGMPKGDAGDAPPPRAWPSGWQIGTPDAVFRMPEPFAVPAETPKGGVPYQHFVVDPGFKEDVWVSHAEARPGAAEVVHHILVFILHPGRGHNPGAADAVLCGMAPGEMPLMLPAGHAKKVPAGARLMFQMHYTPNGRAQADRSSVALRFAKEAPTHRVFTYPVHNIWFRTRLASIAPGDDNCELVASHTMPADAKILAFMPHMHVRGKDFKFELKHGAEKRVLLNVPAYNFNWQSVYRPKEPVVVPAGAKIICTAHFDNSAKNRNNPDPSERVYWGDQTWQEMMIGWFDYAVALKTP
ncbi:MAG: redoxin domain-containing protein, partial [Gemmataceae bacterium]